MSLQLHYWYLIQRYRCSEKKGHLFIAGPISSRRANVHSSNGHSHQTMERTKMPFNRRMDKEDMVHIYNGVVSLHQKG